MELLNLLKTLNINYEIQKHKTLLTIDDAKQIHYEIDGIGTKSLLLKDKILNDYYIVVIHEDKKVDFKLIKETLNSHKLRFATKEELKEVLNLDYGVTPMGIINDKLKLVKCVLIDKIFENNKLLVHPNKPDESMSISYNDLIKFINNLNHKYLTVEM